MSQEAVFTVAHNVVHLRAKPSNDSEQVSQLLMGQNVKSLREDNGWAYVEGPDTYRGWADRRWLTAYTPDAHAIVSEIFAEMRELPKKTAPLMMRIPILAALISDGPLDLLNPSWQSVTTPDEAYRGYIQESKMYPLTRPRNAGRHRRIRRETLPRFSGDAVPVGRVIVLWIGLLRVRATLLSVNGYHFTARRRYSTG